MLRGHISLRSDALAKAGIQRLQLDTVKRKLDVRFAGVT